jgi:hypothetical protein
MRDLFGSEKVLAVPDLPTHLRQVYERLKHFGGPELKDWITKHTFFQYYTTFTKQDVKLKVYDAIVTGCYPGSLHMMTGVMASSISEPTYFRYCHYCVEDDLQTHGETYWRLSHQLPCTAMCNKHESLLRDSKIPFRSKNKHEFTAATRDCFTLDKEQSNYSEKTTQFLNFFAQESFKLTQQNYEFTLDNIQQAYKYLLQNSRFANINGKIDQQALAQQFQLFYGNEFLSIMQSKLYPESQSCWLKSITRKHRKIFHPTRHLLLIHFLGESIDTFYQYSKKEYQPFGEGPYLCLNAAAVHYLKPVIPDVTVTICSDTRRPVGTFSCSCGFCYSRRGPDVNGESRYRIGRIKQYGQIWQDKLHHLLQIEKIGLYETAKCLNVDLGTVKKYANRDINLQSSKVSDQPNLLFKKQKQWLELQNLYHNYTKTELRNLNSALYTWLYRNNKSWLNDHSPNKKILKRTSNRVDWKKRDLEVLEGVKKAVDRFLSSSKPIFINKSRIGKEIRKLALLEKHLDKLPKTQRYLNEIVETIEQFQIRRVQWATQKLLEDDQETLEWKIKRLAGLKEVVAVSVQHEISTQIHLY